MRTLGLAVLVVLGSASIAGAQANIKPVGPSTPPSKRPGAVAKKATGPEERVVVSVNASYLTASRTFSFRPRMPRRAAADARRLRVRL